MGVSVDIDIAYEFAVKAPFKQVFDLLSDVPASVSHFPQVDRLVDLGEGLLELLARVEIVHFPLLMDQKYAGRAGEGDGPELPAADLGLVSGGVASEEQRAILLAMRRSCRTLIALGTCATHGGIPALANERSQAAVRAGVFADCGPAPAEAPACLEPFG